MDYSISPDTVVDAGTGHRKHQDDQAVPSEFTAKDVNSLIWSLMEIVVAGGQAPAQFDPAVPASYGKVLAALNSLYLKQAGADARYLKLSGGQAMSGLFSLFGNAVSALQPTTLQQVGILIGTALDTRPGHVYTNNDWTWLNRVGGMILQWGQSIVPTGNGDVITLTTPFTAALLGLVCTDYGSGATSQSWTPNGASLSTFKAYARGSGSYQSAAYGYLSWGY